LRSTATWPALCVAGLLIAAGWMGWAGLSVAGGTGLATGVLLCFLARRGWPENGTISRAVLLPAAAVVGTHAFAAIQSRLPPGVDAAFHCTVALHFANTGRITPDLRPLEDLTLNYPTGSHFLVASLTRLANALKLDVPPHLAFKLWFPIAAAAATLTVACFEPVLGSGTGVATGWVYALGIYQISLFPYTWGGLPSLLAMWLVMAGTLYLHALPTTRGSLIAGLLWGGAMLAHHHTAVALVIGAAGVALHLWKRWRETARQTVTAVSVAVLASAPYWWRLVLNLPSLGSTGMLGYVEPFQFPWTLVWQMGPIFLVGSVVFALRRQPSGKCVRYLTALGVTWLVVFLVLDYGIRAASGLVMGRAVTPFTPSRFLFDLQWAFCPLVGAAFARLSRGHSIAVLAIACVATGIWGTWDRWTGTPLSALPRWIAEGRLRRAEGTILREDFVLEPGAYVARVAPPRAVILGTPGQVWLTYCTRRESTCLFLPISEPISDRIRLKWRMLQRPTARTWQAWSRSLGDVPIWAILPAHITLPGEQVLRVFHPLKVVRLWPPSAPERPPKVLGRPSGRPAR